jgi:hypothetical protein
MRGLEPTTFCMATRLGVRMDVPVSPDSLRRLKVVQRSPA